MGASYWVDAEAAWDKVVALTDDVIYVANPGKDQALAMKQALARGELASTVIKDDAEAILLTTVQKISYNRHDDDVDVHYKAGKEKDTKTIYFSSSQERDAFAAELSLRLPDFQGKVVEYGRVRAALAPLGVGLGVGLVTWALHAAASEIAGGREADFHGRNAAIKQVVFWLLDWIGPVGVLVVGGLLLALCGAGLVARVKTPPIMHTLKRVRA